MDNLKELYIDQLQDLWSANRQAYKMTEKLCDVAECNELRETLQRSLQRITEHNQRLEEMITSHDAKPDEEHCKGMEGLVQEDRKHAIEADIENTDVRDAQIIAQYQRMTHYGIAVYGTCHALAEQLGFEEEAQLLDDDLGNVKKGDRVMTRIAVETVNRRAA